MSKPLEPEAYANQRLNLVTNGKAHRRKATVSNRTWEPAVRDYRGASGNVAMVEMGTQLALERAGLVTLRLQPARRNAIPTKYSSYAGGDE